MSLHSECSSLGLSAAVNVTVLLMAIERLANANNSLRRLGCCWQATFFILELLLLVATAAFALLAFEDRMGTRIQRGENYL